MIEKILAMGVLRNGLHGIAVLFTLLMPFAGGPDYSDTWDLFFSGILPATAPIVVVLIGLDIMMCSIWRSEATAERAAVLSSIIRTHWVVGAVLLGAWLAVFLPVLV